MDHHNHAEKLAAVRAKMPADELLCDLGDLFKIFGDTTRIKILFSLFEEELCVCAIAELLGMNQSAISHQLKVLKDAKLVCSRREGKTVYYSLADDHVNLIISQGFNHLIEENEIVKKTYRLEDLDCAHCAAKMEDGIRKLEGVSAVTINFLAQKLIVEAEEERLDAIMKEAAKIVKKIEPDCRIVF